MVGGGSSCGRQRACSEARPFSPSTPHQSWSDPPPPPDLSSSSLIRALPPPSLSSRCPLSPLLGASLARPIPPPSGPGSSYDHPTLRPLIAEFTDPPPDLLSLPQVPSRAARSQPAQPRPLARSVRVSRSTGPCRSPLPLQLDSPAIPAQRSLSARPPLRLLSLSSQHLSLSRSATFSLSIALFHSPWPTRSPPTRPSSLLARHGSKPGIQEA